MQTYTIIFSYAFHLLVVISVAEQLQPLWVQLSTCWVQGLSVLPIKLSAKRVYGNYKRSSVCFKLDKGYKKNIYLLIKNIRVNILGQTSFSFPAGFPKI